MMKSIKTSVVALLCLFLTGFAASAQQKISGTVVDSYGETVIGAGVFQKDTNNGTVTDVDGKFSLTVPEGATVVVSCIGYKDYEFRIDSKRVYSITLQEDTEALEAVEVVAYGTQKKVTVTGALSSVKS